MAHWTGTSRNDTKNGTSSADHLPGLRGNNKLDGREGNDILVGGAGNDVLNGGTGVDTAAFNGKRPDFRIISFGGVTTVQDLGRGSPEGTDTLTSIERLVFSDMTVDLTLKRLSAISAWVLKQCGFRTAWLRAQKIWCFVNKNPSTGLLHPGYA